MTFQVAGPSGRERAAAPSPANHESSQMFTLAALVGRATSPAPATQKPGVAAPAAKREGSGIIDLNALARAAEERARRAQSEPPPSVFTREASPVEAPPASSRRLRFVGLAAAACALAIVGLIVGVSGGDEPKPRAAAAHVEPPKAEPAPAPAPAPIAVAPPQDSTSVSSAAQPPKSGGSGKWSAGSGRKSASKAAPAGPRVNMTKVTSGGLSAKSSPAAPAKPAPGADPCGCKGNLMCAIKCFK